MTWSLLLLCCALSTPSADPPPVVTLAAVLSQVETHPVALGAAARVDVASAQALTADGGFDPVLSAQAAAQPLGPDAYHRFDISLQQPTPLWGTSLLLGYRQGRAFPGAAIPAYVGGYETENAGEVRAGVVVPLWRDGAIDARRAATARASWLSQSAEHDRDARLLRLRLAASDAYLRTVAAAEKLRLADGVLALAVERDAQTRERVAAGAIAAVEQVENDRAVFQRRQAREIAARSFERAAVALSFYWRDAKGTPVVVAIGALPKPAVSSLSPASPDAVARALERRPELLRLNAQLEAREVSLRLADNQVAPRVDVAAVAATDLTTEKATFGVAPKKPTAEVSLQVSLPLLLRDARGRAREQHAELQALQIELRQTRDQVRMEVEEATIAFDRSKAALGFADASRGAARTLADGERERFSLGQTSMLFVNIREMQALEAEQAYVDAWFDAEWARLWLTWATGDSPKV